MHLALITLNAPLNGADSEVMRLGSMVSQDELSFLIEVSDKILFVRRHAERRSVFYSKGLTVCVKDYMSISLRACLGFCFSWHAFQY